MRRTLLNIFLFVESSVEKTIASEKGMNGEEGGRVLRPHTRIECMEFFFAVGCNGCLCCLGDSLLCGVSSLEKLASLLLYYCT